MSVGLKCECCGEKMALYVNGKCHPEAAVQIFMMGELAVGGKLIAECSECGKEIAEFGVSSIVDLEKFRHPRRRKCKEG